MSGASASSSDRTMHVHQFVKVAVSPTKTEIGVIVALRGDEADVATRHGFNVTAQLSQLRRVFLLVLDLNGVLVARQKQKFVKRPFVDEFVKFALSNFVVAVWSSCEERNGKHIVEDVFGGLQDRLLFQMYRPDCRPFPTKERPYGTIKDLQKIFDRYPESFNALTTIIVDDSPDKCSHPDIALCPPPFAVSDSGEVISDGEAPGQSGLAGTMDVLRLVLQEDSVAPLIDAAAHRIELMEQRAAAAASLAPAPVTGEPPVSNILQQLLKAHPEASLPPHGPAAVGSSCDVMTLFKQKFSEAALKELQTANSSQPEAPVPAPAVAPALDRSSGNDKKQHASRHHRASDGVGPGPQNEDKRSGNVVSILRNAHRVPQ